MKAKPWELTIVCKKRQVVVKVEPETTTFSDVIDKVRFELKKKEVLMTSDMQQQLLNNFL